ncbi:MAG: hypothetical protein K0R93_1006 [Anaerosolibacter sp.]|jgi:hypothetical protein|uniref:DUF262 domain-containing protein n=1 Tax=Anaerosolibacter sp. TaxID=1872527 RepID=UPI0026071A92|nr:DUF262 domain-containing protein [Anaerosolibacter sp.]MDF2546108.1 hypothetical protein [Anaerosolibacter sp.]
MTGRKRYGRKTTGITISIFYEHHQLDKFNFDAPYQRDYNVWDANQKSFLIDSIMKNFPMPPIFLEQKINPGTGITKYDVIDGKQRLTAIIDFIENKIALPGSFGDDEYGHAIMANKTFNQLQEISNDNEEIKDFISDFWSYVISIEYIENPDVKIVDNIFDRLNRGGERLNNQELRKANYYDNIIYQHIEELKKDEFLSDILRNLNKNRLEDASFITEIYLLVATGSVIDGTEPQIDKYFRQLVEEIDEDKSNSIVTAIHHIKEIAKEFDLDYDKYHIRGVSHLYAIWYLAYYMYINHIAPDEKFNNKLNQFYLNLRESRDDHNVAEYHKSMQSASKFRHSRRKRVTALLNYFNFDFVEKTI